ncbi:TauD/TfdA family dioxygenase [Alteromonas sp. ASW11-130]|uniref:TauD/TfdA family dioxygenase n=1 Tax=Alteromonas sp. ASW11-130 TaxID=3015775 RepID=UPI002241CF84|nr:TauD/TfdA family dioxygenase [Alteromonas sp. ASW11-130]MCW8092488.1 TauD/TfdA family dioxygenase [Alteromonas sp. ASW11-130]
MKEQDFPRVIKAPEPEMELINWIKKESLPEELAKHGAILFRGFKHMTAEQLGELVKSVSTEEFYNEEESSPRDKIVGNIYTSTSYRADQEIFLHNENSYKNIFPGKLFFYCDCPAEEGGETPIADCRKIFNRLGKDVIDKFSDKKWMYVRNFIEGIGISWQEAFNTNDRSVVEKYCQEEDISFEWVDENSLRTRQVRSPFLRHPISNELSWFNHATFFNIGTLQEDIREALLSIYDVEDLSHNTFYGDGTQIEEDVLAELQGAYKSEAVDVQWEKGDLVILDNLLTAHARKSFKGKRSIMLAQVDPVIRSKLEQ